jgi:hypothetical protein
MEPRALGPSKALILRQIAPTILTVLKSRPSSSFQDVADAIIADLGGEPLDSRGERTVRRRVYDVLNVFVAVGYAERDGKTIICSRSPDLQSAPSGDSIRQKIELRQTELADKVRMLIAWRLLIERNRLRERPSCAVPILQTLFVGFARCQGGGYDQGLDGRSVAIHAESLPVFFTPMEVIAKMGFPIEEQVGVMTQYPELQPIVPRLFPEGGE